MLVAGDAGSSNSATFKEPQISYHHIGVSNKGILYLLHADILFPGL